MSTWFAGSPWTNAYTIMSSQLHWATGTRGQLYTPYKQKISRFIWSLCEEEEAEEEEDIYLAQTMTVTIAHRTIEQ